MIRERIEREYPVAVTLRFRDQAQRDFFMGQLSDGWGENQCELTWDGRRSFARNDVFGVDLPEDDIAEIAECERRRAKRLE